MLLLLLAVLPSFVQGRFCTPVENSTWAGFVKTLDDLTGDGSPYAILCPFEINGDACHSEDDYPNGYVVDGQRDLIIVCDPDLMGFNLDSECTIDCPGRHFTVDQYSSLTLEGMIMTGATDSSISVQPNARLLVRDSMLRR
jgi:hypothetical protein